MGKSVLGIHLLRTTTHRLNQPFDFDTNIIYNPDVKQIWDKVLYSTPRYTPIMLDEAITALYKMGFASTAQKTINKLYAVCRKENKISVLCIPNFFDLNTFFRNRRVMVWIEVVGRGHAVMFIRDWSPFNPDRWHTKESQKVIEKFTRKRSIIRLRVEDKIAILRRLPNYVADFEFDDLPADIKREYNKRAKAIKYEMKADGGVSGLAKKYKNAAYNTIAELYKAGKTQKQIETITGLSIATVNRALKNAGARKSDR